MSKSECAFRLLEPVTSRTDPDAKCIEISGRRWKISKYDQLSEAPPYTCISYAWGEDRVPNIYDDQYLMSGRTIPVIEATINSSQSRDTWFNCVQFSNDRDVNKENMGVAAALKAAQAIWIDALCVPSQEPARTSCLRSMGEIYSSAWQVFVVLSKSCSDVLQSIRAAGRIDPEALFRLETEDWISRAWTYQETVNSRSLFFVVEDDETTLISGLDFLDAVMKAIDEYRELHEVDRPTWMKIHPLLDRFEALLADYRISGYATRSAYQVMSVMDQRICNQAEDYFYAMIGAIAETQLTIEGEELMHPSEYFMRVCEKKGDYSFIYSVTPRSKIPGRRWRPLEGKFSAVLPIPIVFGAQQAGRHERRYLQLENMCRLHPGAITPDGLRAAKSFMGMRGLELSPDGIAPAILERLTTLGFTGCGEYLEVQNGFFFPHSKTWQHDDIFVVISRDLHWVTGGPGLLLRPTSTHINEFCDVGAFVGRIPKLGESIKVG